MRSAIAFFGERLDVAPEQEDDSTVATSGNCLTAIYCGTALASSVLSGCSAAHCPAPAHAQIEGSIYTRGRGIIFSFRSHAAVPDQRTNVGFWVMWR